MSRRALLVGVAMLAVACSGTPTPDATGEPTPEATAVPDGGHGSGPAVPEDTTGPPLSRQAYTAPPLQRSGVEATGELTRESIAILDDLEAQDTDAGALVTLPDTVLFDFDEAELRSTAADVLDDLVTVIQDAAPAGVTIDGHTDGRGDDAYNQDLSERRAAAVQAYLVDAGVAPDRLTATGHGEDQPLVAETDAAGEDDPEARARNRRVEITITGVDLG